MKKVTSLAMALIVPVVTIGLSVGTIGHSSVAAVADETDPAQLIRTRDITGGPIYTTNEAYDSWGVDANYTWGWSDHDEVDSNWKQIGEIEDLVLDRSGALVGVVAEVGGFLGIGDKHVMLRVGDVDLVPVDGRSYSFITRYSEEQLEELPGVDEAAWD